jgi:hypothetical protein
MLDSEQKARPSWLEYEIEPKINLFNFDDRGTRELCGSATRFHITDASSRAALHIAPKMGVEKETACSGIFVPELRRGKKQCKIIAWTNCAR